MKSSRLLILLCAIFVSCVQSKTIDITKVKQKNLNSGIVVDVRTPEEYNLGHLDNALNINWYDEDFASQFDAVPKDKTLYVYCKKGGRSAKAQEKLISLGFKKVVNLDGGYDAFTAAPKD